MDSLIGTCVKANDSVIIRLRDSPLLPNEMSYQPGYDYFFISSFLLLSMIFSINLDFLNFFYIYELLHVFGILTLVQFYSLFSH